MEGGIGRLARNAEDETTEAIESLRHSVKMGQGRCAVRGLAGTGIGCWNECYMISRFFLHQLRVPHKRGSVHKKQGDGGEGSGWYMRAAGWRLS